MPGPGGIVPPNLVPRLLIDLRTNMNPIGGKTTNLSNKIDLCEWINYWMENGCITGGITDPGGPFILYAENGLHKKNVDDPTATNANSTVHLGGALLENTTVTVDGNRLNLFDAGTVSTYQQGYILNGNTGQQLLQNESVPGAGNSMSLTVANSAIRLRASGNPALPVLFNPSTELWIEPDRWYITNGTAIPSASIIGADNSREGIEFHYGSSDLVTPVATQWYRFPAADGNSGDVMQTDGSGIISWQPIATLDTHLMDTNQTNTTGGAISHDGGGQNWGITNMVNLTLIATGDYDFDCNNYVLTGGGVTADATISDFRTYQWTSAGGGLFEFIGNGSDFSATVGTATFTTGATGIFSVNGPVITFALDNTTREASFTGFSGSNSLTIGGNLNPVFTANFKRISLTADAISGFLRLIPETGAPAIGDIATASAITGDMTWTSPATAISGVFTWGSGIDITGTTVDWNGALTQPVAIDGGFHAHQIAFNAIDSFIVDTDGAVGISLTQGPNASGDITISNTSLNSDVTISSTNGGDITLNSTLGEYNFTTAPATDNTITSLVGLNGTNQLRVRDTSTLPVPSNTVTSYGIGNNVIPGTDDVALKSAITPGDTMTLPDAATVSGKKMVIKDTSGTAGANNITIDTVAGNIDGVATILINQNYMAVTFISDGTDYWII